MTMIIFLWQVNEAQCGRVITVGSLGDTKQQRGRLQDHHWGQLQTSGDALFSRPYPSACAHCQKVEWQSGSKKVWAITAAAIVDTWDCPILRWEQLDNN
jgi:hypothetical protein